MNELRWFVPVGLLVLLTVSLRTWAADARSEASSSQTVPAAAIVPLSGEIDDYSRDDLIRRFERARQMGASVIIVDVNSPGGLVTASMDISQYLKRQTGVHTIAFIEKAYSGAAMVSVACDEIWMAPSAPLGDCAPIVFSTSGQLQPMPDTERAKAESPVIAEFLDSARRNGYDPTLLEGMVSLRHSAYVMTNAAGALRVVDAAERNRLTSEADGWTLAPGFESVDGPDKLVTMSAAQAVALHVARGQAASSHALAADRGYTLIADLRPSMGERLVQMLNAPVVRGLLLSIFMMCLYIALHAPGHGAAEAIGILALGLLVGIPLLTGYAQWWEVAMIFVGLALCAFEIFVFPGHMVSLIVGSIMVLCGTVLTFSGREPSGVPGWLPTMRGTWEGIQTGLIVVVSALACCSVLCLWLRRYLPSIPYFNKLILTATTGNTAELVRGGADGPPLTDPWPFVGTVGVAVTDLRPGGSAEFPYADTTRPAAVVSAGGFVSRGSKIEVVEVHGNHVRVRTSSRQPPPPGVRP